MKTNIFKLLIIVWIISLTACKNNSKEMFTYINPDGSCCREFISEADSAFMAGDTSHNPFPMLLDSTWLLTFSKQMHQGIVKINKPFAKGKLIDRDSTVKKIVVARRTYKSVKELAETFRFDDSNWKSVAPKIEFNKKFRWFYTFYEFSETYPKHNPLKKVPVKNYLSDEEILTFYSEKTDLYKGKNGNEIKELLGGIEKKSNAWLNRSLYEEFYQIMLKHFKELKQIPVDCTTLVTAKDKIYKLQKDSFKDNNTDYDKLLDNYFHTKAFTKLLSSDNEVGKIIDKEMKLSTEDLFDPFQMELTYRLMMPGKVLETNTSLIKGDTLSWKIDVYRFFFTDYRLYAKSRIANIWAFGISGAFILLVILSFFLIKSKNIRA